MKIKNHILIGDFVDFRDTPNKSGKFKTGLPDTIIIHYTSGSSRMSSVNTLCNPRTKASAHLVIGRDGKITQLVPFNTVAWHAGESAFGNRSGLNNYSIGIEIDNAGILTKSGETYSSWFGKIYSPEDVMSGIHRNRTKTEYWHRYTEWQIEICRAICDMLISTYGVKTILGHEEISPGRKIDPGPAFPLDKFREMLLETDRSSDQPIQEEVPLKDVMSVKASSLNIRSLPDATSQTVANPLPKGQKVNVISEQNGWVKVKLEVEGWVKREYLE